MVLLSQSEVGEECGHQLGVVRVPVVGRRREKKRVGVEWCMFAIWR